CAPLPCPATHSSPSRGTSGSAARSAPYSGRCSFWKAPSVRTWASGRSGSSASAPRSPLSGSSS
ncbi:MAG: hypothetical protein AVDCRST_MAG49-1831, partial [uncultured Thermomicrobiales bacterium]